MTALQYFRLLCSEFGSTLDATVTQWLTIATADVFAPCLNAADLSRAQALYAGHLMKLEQDASSGLSGPIKSEREGDLSRTYGDVNGGETILGSTNYGIQYKTLVGRCFGTGIMTRF